MWEHAEIVTIGERIVITTNGTYPTSVFKERFSSDRYGKEAIQKAHDYAKSLWGSEIIIKGRKFRIKGHDLMMGACDYVGSLLFLVEEE